MLTLFTCHPWLSVFSLQTYADGSQYMASHDSLSPPYTNSRLTGTPLAVCVCVVVTLVQPLSLSNSPTPLWPNCWALCAHLPMMLSASGSVHCGASCEQMATDTDNLPLSFFLMHKQTHTRSLITSDWMHQIWRLSDQSSTCVLALCRFV